MTETLFDAIRRHAQDAPTRVALHGDHGPVSYSMLLERVEALANWLRDQAPQRVALCGENSVDWIVADLAAWRAGIVAVPIPSFFSPAQVEHVFAVTQLTHRLVCGAQSEIAAGTERSDSPFPEICLDCIAPAPAALAPLPPGTCKITFTSGSTGQPKGVCLLPSNLTAVMHALAERMRAADVKINPALDLGDSLDRHFTLLPLSTLLENVAGVYVPLLLGRSVVVRSGAAVGLTGSSGLDLPQLLHALQREQPSSLIVLPQVLRALVAAAERGLAPPASLRFVAVGGAPTPPALIEQARALGIPVFEGYGLSECASVVALNAPGADRIGSVGRVLDHVRVRIECGHIEVTGNTFAGYLGEPVAAGAWLDTGDLGHVDADGFLFVSGRAKNLIISSYGRNLSPEWPESALLQCPSIQQVMVFGDARPFCGAIVVPTPGSSNQLLQAQITAANDGLPDYARVQRFIVASKAFSQANGCLTDNGRLRRDVIAATYAAEISNLYAKPSNTSETTLAMSFYERLKRDTQIDRQDFLAAPLIRRCLDGGSFSLQEYIAFLTEAFHHVRHTVPLLMAVGSRLPPEKEAFRNAIAEYIAEELGHQEWILNDLRACGADSEAVRHGQPAAATELMVAYAYDTVMRRNPMGFFGMVFVLEGTSVSLATMAAEIIQKRLGLPGQAFSYLRSHGSLDQAHLQFFEKLMNTITDERDRDDIVHAAQRFFHLYGNIFRSIAVTDLLSKAA